MADIGDQVFIRMRRGWEECKPVSSRWDAGVVNKLLRKYPTRFAVRNPGEPPPKELPHERVSRA